MSSSGGQGGGFGGYEKIAATILGGAAVIGFIIFMGGGGGDDKKPAPEATSAPQLIAASPAPAPTTAPAVTNAQPGAFDKERLRRDFPDSAILTITSYGMPARVSAQAQNPAQVRSQATFALNAGVDFACLPDVQYPGPCVAYIVVQRGAAVTVQAGDSRAGYWPILESISGPGCTHQGTTNGADITCTLTLALDIDLVATYKGNDSRSGDYRYPKCPVIDDRARVVAASPWVARCQ